MLKNRKRFAVIPVCGRQKEVIRLNFATHRSRGPALVLRSFLPVFLLLLQATAFSIPVLAAESAESQAARQRFKFKAAIPKDSPGAPDAREELAKGKFLVASRQLRDPNFIETVVLLIDYGPDGAMGLVINRPSTVKLSTVFPDVKELEQRDDTIYVGGPVAANQMLLLIRSTRTPQQSIPVIDDVYISSSWKLLERLMKNAGKNEHYRLFAGYAGWAPSQLDFERTRGDWHVLKAETEMVFSQNPSELWPELIRRASVKWVRATVTGTRD